MSSKKLLPSIKKMAQHEKAQLDAQSLLQWMECDLGIDYRRLPSCEEVQRMLNNEKQASVWGSLRARVASSRAVRQTTLINELRVCESEENQDQQSELLHRRLELVKWVAGVRKSMNYAEAELSEMQRRIEDKETRNRAARRWCDDSRLKKTLLIAYKAKLAKQVTCLKDCSRRCQDQVQQGAKNPKPTTITSSPRKNSPSKMICNDASYEAQMFLRTYIEEQNNQDLEGKHLTQQAHSAGITTPQLLMALAQLTQRDVSSIQNQHASNCGEDQLGSLDPEISNAVANVAVRVTAAQKQHLKRFEEIETLRFQATTWRTNLNELVSEIDEAQASSADDDAERKARSMGWKQDRDIAGAQAGVAAIVARIEEVKQRLAEQQRAAAALEGKQQESDDSALAVQDSKREMQRRIGALTGQREKISAEAARLEAFWESALLARSAALSEACKAAAASLSSVNLSSSSSSPPSQQQQGQETELRDPSHSIADEGPGAAPLGSVVSPGAARCSLARSVLASLGAPRFLGADHAAAQAARSRRREETLRERVGVGRRVLLELRGQSSFRREGNAAVRARVGAELEAWEQQWRAVVMEELGPSVKTCHDAVERSQRIEDLIRDWLQQPGQYAVPWIKVHGRSLVEWMEAISQLAPNEAHELPS